MDRFIIVLILLCFGCEETIKEKSPDELRQELRLREEQAPLIALSVNAKMHENKVQIQKPSLFQHSKYITDGWILTGTVKNSAALARFKDVQIIVTFYTQTKTAISSKSFTIYKYFNPGEVTAFEFKVYPPAVFESFQMVINRATAI